MISGQMRKATAVRASCRLLRRPSSHRSLPSPNVSLPSRRGAMDNAIVGLQVGKERPYHIIFMRGSRLLGTLAAAVGARVAARVGGRQDLALRPSGAV